MANFVKRTRGEKKKNRNFITWVRKKKSNLLNSSGKKCEFCKTIAEKNREVWQSVVNPAISFPSKSQNLC